MSKINFFKSHEMLLQEKLKTIIQINQMLDRAKADYDNSLNIIATELGIDKADLKNWKVALDQKGLQKKNKGEIKNEQKKSRTT